MHESRFICKENLFRKICSAVPSCSNAKSQHPATEYLRPQIAVAVAAQLGTSILRSRVILRFAYAPHIGARVLEERLARVSKDGHKRRSSQRPSFETGACRHAPSSG